MTQSFQCVGYVKTVRPTGGLVIGEVPGKVALVISDVDAGDTLGYFPRDRRPQVGARVGVLGTWVSMEVPLSALSAEALEDLSCGGRVPMGTPVQFQVDVDAWRVVSEDYDWLFDPFPSDGGSIPSSE